MSVMMERLRERLADALRAVAERLDPEDYPIGTPALDAEGQPMPRCTSCGVPRGTLRHALICKGGGCSDPDATAARELKAACAERETMRDLYAEETLLSNALARALRERGFDHVWNQETTTLTVTSTHDQPS